VACAPLRPVRTGPCPDLSAQYAEYARQANLRCAKPARGAQALRPPIPHSADKHRHRCGSVTICTLNNCKLASITSAGVIYRGIRHAEFVQPCARRPIDCRRHTGVLHGARPGRPHLAAGRAAPASRVARGRRGGHGGRYMVDALHRHAGVFAADSARLRLADHRRIARHRDRRVVFRAGRGHATHAQAAAADRRRHSDGLRHRRHALHRYGRIAHVACHPLPHRPVRRVTRDRDRRGGRRAVDRAHAARLEPAPHPRETNRRRRRDGRRDRRHALHGDGRRRLPARHDLRRARRRRPERRVRRKHAVAGEHCDPVHLGHSDRHARAVAYRCTRNLSGRLGLDAQQPDRAPRDLRHADRPAEPRIAWRAHCAGCSRIACAQYAVRDPVHGPRRLQDDQRFARARVRRRGAEGVRPPSAAMRARVGHGRASRRRRVRDSRRRPLDAAGRRADGRRRAHANAPRHRRRRPAAAGNAEHRHRAVPAGRRDRRHAAQARGRRDVRSETRRPQHLSLLRSAR
jgi:hypothetical protein